MKNFTIYLVLTLCLFLTKVQAQETFESRVRTIAANIENATKEEKEFYKNLYKTFDFNWTPTLEVISKGSVQSKYQYLDE